MQPPHSESREAYGDPPPPEDPGPRFVAPRGAEHVAGTSLRRVAAAAGLPMSLDRTAALWLLAYDTYDMERAFIRNVRHVPWRVPLARDAEGRVSILPATGPQRLRLGVEAAAEAVRRQIEESTRACIGRAERTGVLLSGGLDSSAVAVAAARTWSQMARDPADLRFYHLLPPVGPSEVAHARAVAEHLGHELVAVAPQVDAEAEERLLAALDFPTADAGWALSFAMLSRAAADGVEVLLTGDGGDEAFAAYGTRGERGARGVLRARGATLIGGLTSSMRMRLRPLAPAFLRRAPAPDLPAWLAAQLDGLGKPEPLPPAREGLRGVAAARDRSLRAARQALIVGWWRSAATASDLRVRFPLLSADLADLVVSLPAWVFATRRRPKDLLRRALGASLPPPQQERPKDQPEVEPWLRERLASSEHSTQELLRGGFLECAGVLPSGAAATALEAGRTGSTRDLYRALAMLGLERWCRAHGLAEQDD